MPQLKLQRLKEKYQIPGLDAELREAYVIEDDSLRDVADYINIEITRQFLEGEPFESEIVYRVYNHPEDVAKQTEVGLKKRIQNHGIDIDVLKDNWVGHLAVKSYLNKVLDIDTSRNVEDKEPEEALSKINGLVDYQESLMNRHLAKVRGFDYDQWELHTDVRLINSNTGESVRLQDHFADLQEELEEE
ncbi:hypothetical protein RH831_11260 [Halodesulfurarchaeum sp. HSR-GB]|uniref:rod-determining factor RdfA n=1 Tax=Halodesulfurarchaeum sp. HSR-GB TaxID=3074077 RepID=UPI00285AD09E|nr:rod-determining factor RdfA [Halodesulfurarchaeum sp. HSR-GB]MDR5657753.1 hypothetical protein [Halodesulfurarchaeum sp. HSR-GB]